MAALGLLAQAPQRLGGVTAERVHQDALGLVHDRAGHHGILQLAGRPLHLVVSRRVGQYRAAEGGDHISHGIGLRVEYPGTDAEQ